MTNDIRVKKEELRRYLINLYPAVKESGEHNFRTRCVLCGDSKKDPNKMRLGIKVDPDNIEEPIWFNCFNCGSSGILTNEMLRLITGNAHVTCSVDGINKQISNNNGNTKHNRFKNERVIQVTIPNLRNHPKYIRKAKYIFDRLGTKIHPEEFPSLKLIWSLKDFLNCNCIPPNKEFDINSLDEDYMGYLSVNNDFILFRDITDNHRFRHVKYNIFHFLDNTQCFYQIPTKIDLMTTDDIHVKIAEGPMDILSIFLNLTDSNRFNTIYLAASNGGFYTPLLHYFKKGVVGSNIHIDLYRDNDSKTNFKLLQKRLKPYVMDTHHIQGFYNAYENEKDFGVPLSRIQLEQFL